jgi:hypothetical protein
MPAIPLRLPDQITVDHGPTDLLARFFLAADRAARERGVYLTLRHELDGLVALNERERKDWYRISPLFDPAYSEVSPENSYWIEGRNAAGETVAAQAGRVFFWPDTTLKAEIESLRIFYADPAHMAVPGETIGVTAPSAAAIRGTVVYSGSGWYRPDFRGRALSAILPCISRAYALTRWNTETTVSFVEQTLIDKRVVARYGYRRVEHGLDWHASLKGDIVLALIWMPRAELEDDLRAFLSGAIEDVARAQHRDSGREAIPV